VTGEIRYDHNGPLRKMAEAEGYVMIRRPRMMPFALSLTDWLTLPTTQPRKPRYDR
jgi:hypothetical protein